MSSSSSLSSAVSLLNLGSAPHLIVFWNLCQSRPMRASGLETRYGRLAVAVTRAQGEKIEMLPSFVAKPVDGCIAT